MNYSDLYERIYRPNGYEVCTNTQPTNFWLRLRKNMDCAAIFNEYVK